MNEIIDMITAELIRHETKEKEPPMYRVIILNDSKTPMYFVVQVLINVFHMNEKMANRVMMASHKSGSAICGVFPRDIAEMKIRQVKSIAGKNKYPLSCVMQEE